MFQQSTLTPDNLLHHLYLLPLLQTSLYLHLTVVFTCITKFLVSSDSHYIDLSLIPFLFIFTLPIFSSASLSGYFVLCFNISSTMLFYSQILFHSQPSTFPALQVLSSPTLSPRLPSSALTLFFSFSCNPSLYSPNNRSAWP